MFSANSTALATDHAAFAEAGQTLIWRPVIPTAKESPTQTAVVQEEWVEHKNVSAPSSMPSMQKAAGRWRDFIIRIANEYQVDPHLITAVIQSESNFNHQAISPKGALGLMQVMPQTAERFGFKELFDPENNIRAGTAYLKWLLVRFNDDVILALAAYNAGENAVLRYKGVPPYQETQNYVAKVLRGYKKYEHVEHRLTTAQNQVISATKNLADTERIPKEGMKLMTDMVRVLEQAATLWVAPIKQRM